ncbi:outer membrane beta-barrel protein [Hymenobacter sp. IS2118]|uniref:outer membrane beta-barrel protein n=1 Tax=Hymenobacter sp. IS2118 TaxID=1505605 RepID=UPI0005507A55|nr:outer membrane beta-barrel protein [Hymenobacter sp. IS2118]
MPRFTLLLLITLLGAATASAQTTYRLGLRGGPNWATSTVGESQLSPSSPYNYSASKSAIYRGQIGAVLEMARGRFALQPALMFSQKGERVESFTSISGFAGVSSSETSATNRSNWLELPVNLVYTLHGVQLFAGPYVALAVGGRQRGTLLQSSPYARFAPLHYDEKVEYQDEKLSRRLDAGFNAGLGYRRGPLQLQLGYGLGLRKLQSVPFSMISYSSYYIPTYADEKAYNRVVQLTGTYFLDL